MNKTLQDHVWSILPKEFQEEVKRMWSVEVDCATKYHSELHKHRTSLLYELFGEHLHWQNNMTNQQQSEKYAKSIIDSFGTSGVPCGIKDIQQMIANAYEDGANFALGKQKEDAEDTVIQGWVARNGGGPNDLGLHVYSVKPDRMKNRREWNGHGEMSYLIDCRLFPDLTWESEPIEVELIIKRKKK